MNDEMSYLAGCEQAKVDYEQQTSAFMRGYAETAEALSFNQQMEETEGKKPKRPVLLLARRNNSPYWDWYSRGRSDLWIGTMYGSCALSVGDFYEIDRELSDPEAVGIALQDVELEKSAAKELGGEPYLPGWERV